MPDDATNKVAFLISSAEEEADRFEQEIRALGLENEVRRVASAAQLLPALEAYPSRAPVVLIVDTQEPQGWEQIQALKSSAFNHVPVLAICDDQRCGDAYAYGANAMLPRPTWTHHPQRTAGALAAFWVQLVRLPPVSE